MTRAVLPRSLEELAGLRAARYRRESTEEQGTKYGPAEQDAEIERFMARHDLVDTGIVFTDHHSGWQRSEARPEFTAMMAAAAEGAFDVLVVAYFSRFSRNIRQALEAHDILHQRAADHAARRMTTEAYLAEHARLTAELDGLDEARPVAAVPDADGVVRFLRDLQAAWALGGEEERAALVASVYERIVATDQGIIEVELTEDAMRHGLAIALPELVKVVLARPARLELTTFWSATRCSIH